MKETKNTILKIPLFKHIKFSSTWKEPVFDGARNAIAYLYNDITVVGQFM